MPAVRVPSVRDSTCRVELSAPSFRGAPRRKAAVTSCGGVDSDRTVDGMRVRVIAWPTAGTNTWAVVGVPSRSNDIGCPLIILSPTDFAVAPTFASRTRDQELIVPTSRAARSSTTSVQVPRAFLLLKLLSDPSGRNVPVNGAKPLVIDVEA